MRNAIAVSGAALAASVLAIASGANVGREDTASLTYADVLERSLFENYIHSLQAVQNGPTLDIRGGFLFGEIPQGTPYFVATFPNASALTLDTGAVPIYENAQYDPKLCEGQDPVTCCDPAAAGDSCRAWFDFFKFCYSACVDDAKCQAMQVRMAAGECALFDGRIDGCLLPEGSSDTEETMATDSFMMVWGHRGWGQGRDGGDALVPAGYKVSPFYVISEDLTPVKTISLANVPCDANYTSVRDQDVAECAGYCDKDTKCTAFGFNFESATGNVTCELFRNLTGAEDSYASPSVLYLKNQTALCGGKDESFLLEIWTDGDGVIRGCQPYLKAGDQCRNSESTCYEYEDLTNGNGGCAPDLACMEDGTSGIRKCRAPGTFAEEMERQLQDFFAFPGKALNGTDGAAANSTDMLFFNFSALDWNYLYETASACRTLCEHADVARVCTAYELDRKTEQCIIAYGALCASSFVTNENAVTMVTPNEKVYDQLHEDEPLTELEGYKVIQNGYFPVVPNNASENVRVVDIPCNEFFTEDLVAMETGCLEQCNQWEGCHTVVFQPWENNCVLFKGDGVKWTNSYHLNEYRVTFVKTAELKCAKDQFYGLLVVQYLQYEAAKTDPAVQADWDAYKADTGYGVNGTRDPLVIRGSEEVGECGYPTYTPGTAACIPYVQADALCSLESEPKEFFMNLISADYTGNERTCEKGFHCDSFSEGEEADPKLSAPGYCKSSDE